MRAKEYLEKIFDLNERINSKQAELSILNELVKSVSVNLNPDKVQTSGDKDQLGKLVAKIVDMQHEINSMIDQYVDELKQVTDIIAKVRNEKERDLLHKRYIQGMKFADIADIWGCSRTWVHGVKNSAYSSVDEILKSN